MSRFTLLLSFVIASTVCITFVHAAQGGEVVLVPLTSNWSLRSTSENATTVFYPVTVPNTVVGALLELNDVQVAAGAPSMFNFPDGGTDPFYGKNLEGIPTANFSVPWTFSTTFTVPTTSATKDDTAALYYVLQLNGINYAATVSINNVQVDEGKVIGGIRRFVLDVDAILNTTGPNALSLTLTPPLNSWSTDLSFSFLDWAPFPADNSMGIWRDVNLLGLPRFQTLSQPPQAVAFFADGISVNTYLPSAVSSASQPAYITIQITVRCFPLDACNNVTTGQVALSLVVQTTCPGIETLALPLCKTTTFTPSDDGDSGEARFVYSWEQNSALVMQDPPLWWPWQMGDQPLFRLFVQLENYNISTPGGHQFGLRQMTQTETQGGACQLLVNNIPLLIRGAGWAPDLFYRIVQNTAGGNESRIQHQLEMVRHMNLNTIRLEGKFEYANFFEIASELGILVIPGIECCTSWQNWPNWTASMTDIARRSVRDQARRLAHYACNVAFLESSDELPPQAVEEMYRTVLLEEAWPNALIAAASEQESNISGSTGVKMTGPYSWIPPVYWLGDTNGITLDYGGAWGFLTEGGPGEAPMTFASWARTVPQEHLWNASEGGSMSSWWNAHMGNPLGVFGNLRRYTPPLDARFGASSSAQEYCYKAQLQNYEGIRAMFEGYSLMKHANATGVIQWMLNDAYPNHLWHLYDYYLVAGGGYYGAKAAGEPIHALLSYVDGTVALINNRFTDAMGPYTVTVKAFAVVPTFAEFYASEPYSVSILPSDAALTLFAVDLAQLNFLAKEAAPQPNNTATPYLVQLEVTTGATYMPVTSSWYIMSTRMDAVNWTDGNNLWSNCSQWADFTMLQDAPKAEVAFLDVTMGPAVGYVDRVQVSATLINTSPAAVAMFSHVTAVCSETGLELAPAFWNDNFVTLLPSTNKTLQATIYRGSCLSVELRVDSYPAMGTNTARWTLV